MMPEDAHAVRASSGTLSTMVFFKRLIRAMRIAGKDPRIPTPLRWIAALGLLPIPGPVDEIVLIIVAVPLAIFYRGPLKEAWHQARA